MDWNACRGMHLEQTAQHHCAMRCQGASDSRGSRAIGPLFAGRSVLPDAEDNIESSSKADRDSNRP